MRLLRIGSIYLLGCTAAFMVLLNVYASMQQQPPRTFEDLRDQVVYNTARLDAIEREVMQLRRGDASGDIRVLQSDITSIHQRINNLEVHLDNAIYTGFGLLSFGMSVLGFLIRRWILSVEGVHRHNKEDD
jgi:hypothetical protein